MSNELQWLRWRLRDHPNRPRDCNCVRCEAAASIKDLSRKHAAERSLADRLADALRHSEEKFYADYFEEGVVTDKIRGYVATHESLAAYKEARSG
jgi:hypothetical protein